MFASTKYFFSLMLRNKVTVIVLLSLVLVITLTYKAVARSSIALSLYDIAQNSPDPCKVTREIQNIRQLRNTSLVDPAKYVVEELLEIVTFNPNICSESNEGEYLAVAIVNSARDHFKERELIRTTWGSVTTYKKWSVRTVFLIGQSNFCVGQNTADATKIGSESSEKRLEKSLIAEDQEYGDVVIGAFTDTYKNLTYKHLMGYKFILEKCPEADFVIKTDDDMFVDIPAILDMRIMELENADDEKGSTHYHETPFDIYCHNYYRDGPSRNPADKWYSTREEWPEDSYPIYCLGNDYAISMEWLEKIYSVRSVGGFFWVDDVFIMGKLRKIAEQTYNESTKILDMRAIGKAIDPRSVPTYIKDNCEADDFKFGWFIFFDRYNPYFSSSIECLWRRAQRNANIHA